MRKTTFRYGTLIVVAIGFLYALLLRSDHLYAQFKRSGDTWMKLYIGESYGQSYSVYIGEGGALQVLEAGKDKAEAIDIGRGDPWRAGFLTPKALEFVQLLVAELEAMPHPLDNRMGLGVDLELNVNGTSYRCQYFISEQIRYVVGSLDSEKTMTDEELRAAQIVREIVDIALEHSPVHIEPAAGKEALCELLDP